MKLACMMSACLALILAGCAAAQTVTPTITASPTPVPFTSTPRIRMLPTWTPAPTEPPKASLTPRRTSTPLVTPDLTQPSLPTISLSTELLVDRPTSSTLDKPANLVTLKYDPATWMLNTAYPTAFMGYSLTHRSIYGCILEPSVGKGFEGYQVEQYKRPLGGTTFEITRASQGAVLAYANYCTGEGEDHTCYQVTPGSDHPACMQAAETVLGSYQLITNPFYGALISAPNDWLCQDQAGTDGRCTISYSVPLNAFAFTEDGQGWAGGDDGLIYHLVGQAWTAAGSPTTHPIYDLSFSSPTNGWAVGAGAQVLHWDGNEWTEVLPYHGPGEGPGGSTQWLYAVDAVSRREAWMVGRIKGIDGKIRPYALRWNGSDLIEETAFPDCNCGLNAVLAVSNDDVVAIGGSDLGAVAFHWDGTSWSGMPIQGSDQLYALSQAADGSLWASGMEVARDQTDTRGTLFHWDGSAWQRSAVPPLTGGVYALAVRPTGEIILGGDFTALRTGLEWQPIITSIAGYGWIMDIEADAQGQVWALTHSGNIFKLEMGNK